MVSFDKSKSIQYNLKKWCIRLKLVTADPSPAQMQEMRFYKYAKVTNHALFDDDESCEKQLIVLDRKDFTPEDTLFVGHHDQSPMFQLRIRERERRKITGDEMSDGTSSIDGE